jgi:hypothetical protein
MFRVASFAPRRHAGDQRRVKPAFARYPSVSYRRCARP